MRGDLHTLKKVCSYASKVMMVGEIAFALLSIATLCLGVASFISDDIRETFTSLIRTEDSDLSLISGTLEMVVLFVVMFITVKTIHDIMVSIIEEYSPFMEPHANRFKTVSVTFLISSVLLFVLEYLARTDLVLATCMLLVCLLISVVMYCLTIIFRYGSQLQDDSDHTL